MVQKSQQTTTVWMGCIEPYKFVGSLSISNWIGFNSFEKNVSQIMGNLPQMSAQIGVKIKHNH